MTSVRPNVLFITADQWRGDFLGAAGHPVVRTPHADALAAEGTYFARHYSQATPCSPARACLYTGLYQMTARVVRNGTPLDARHDNIARMFRRAGYDPTLFGYTDQAVDPRTTSGDDPWLTTYEGVLPGFTTRLRLPEDNGPWLSWLAARGHEIPANSWDIYLPGSGASEHPTTSPARYGADETETAFVAGEFLRWLGEQSPHRPWFAHVSFLRPHPPFVVPEPYNTMYDPADPMPFARLASPADEARLHPLVAYWLDIARRGSNHFVIGAGDETVASWSDADFRVVRAIYWGMISEVDRQLGRVVAGLKAAGAWDNTIIVLTSDHGEMMGDHWTLGKFGFFDPSCHVPLIIRTPGRSEGGRVRGFSEAIDIVPTLLELAGLPNPGHLDGMSLVPWLDGDRTGAPRQEVHWEYDFRDPATRRSQQHFGLPLDALNMAVLRDDRFKYVHFSDLPPLLFDLREDPDECVNRAGDPALANVRLDMAERMLSWRARHLDRRLTGLELTPNGVVDGRLFDSDAGTPG
jgi:arylsulfatase A-like enzyme